MGLSLFPVSHQGGLNRFEKIDSESKEALFAGILL